MVNQFIIKLYILLSTTQIYAKVLDKRKQDAVSLIPNLGEK